MKRYLILILSLCCLFNNVYGQTPSAAIDSLIKFEIIAAKQRPVLLKALQNKGYPSQRVAILGGLHGFMLQKTFHIDPYKTGIIDIYDNKHINKKIQDSINTSLLVLLEKIRRAGLLTSRVYSSTLKGIDSDQYMMDVQLTGHLAEMSSRLEWLAPSKLIPVAEELHKNGIVSDSSFWRLEDDIRENKIESASQLNGYCKFNRTFNPEKYSDGPEVWLEQIHRDIAAMLPGLNFTNFSYTTIPDTGFSIGGVPGVRFKVSLTCNGRTYKHTSIPFNFRNKQGKILFDDNLGGDFHRIFNKILADEQSPYRLHLVMFSRPDGGDNYRRFTLIALQGEQAEIFMKEPCMSYMFLSMENYDNTLTSASIDSAIAGWKSIGLFAHLSEAEINQAIEDAAADEVLSINYLLTKFPAVTYSLNSAMMSPHYTYRDLLTHLAKITHGAFNPTNIRQRKVKSGVIIQYTAKGKIHTFMFSSEYAWMDVKFPAFVKGLGRENSLPGKFYPLRFEGSFVYLTTQQHEYISTHHLLDLGQE